MSNSVSRQVTNGVPEPVAPIAELMSTFRAPWALCGGWAVDAWVGHQTREHPDVDISAFIQDQQAVFDHMAGWQLFAHVSGDTHAPWDGRRLDLPNHIMGRIDTGEVLPEGVDTTAEQGFILDIQLSDLSGEEWVLSDEPRVSLALSNAVRQSPWGIPAVVPEVLLFFKALELRRRDKWDFRALLPSLTRAQREWLREAIAAVGHPWVAELAP